MNTRTKKTAIPRHVKERVYTRDNGKCVLCGRWAEPSWACAHFIRRSQGGLGIEENILTLCPRCHRDFDEGPDRKALTGILETYLSSKYDNWSKEDLRYRKWQ